MSGPDQRERERVSVDVGRDAAQFTLVSESGMREQYREQVPLQLRSPGLFAARVGEAVQEPGRLSISISSDTIGDLASIFRRVAGSACRVTLPRF
ncbi:hypothetical protein CC117_11845 [Parafrankia colletiae]|uniref:Uncharacterized protein n=1 Tax=Parafrankia colletiae TaxID=573497 RepID=A0A1S1R9T5_9ACTN|nr:hypothetical protein [Parafrankia colletiae]OHV42275.1 hypothetical protein CC117_11845 [Parafrankia colletiae]